MAMRGHGEALAAIRYKSAGEATLGGADVLADLREACEVGTGRLWVSVEGRGDCIAFYATDGLASVGRAVLFFEGDVPQGYRRDSRKLRRHLDIVRKGLESLARTYRIPYVLMARPGTFGSTGDHRQRRKMREALVMKAAVETLSRRFGLHEVSLAGQSGGATIAAALLTLGLTRVRCATPASGGYDLTAMLDWHAARQGLVGNHAEHPASIHDSFDVSQHVAGVQSDPGRRIFILGDVADKVTPFDQQRRFAERLKASGHHAVLIEASGNGPDRHGLAAASLEAAGMCANGKSDAEIGKAVGRATP
ncbi:MAG: hypothetical protein AB7O57_06960 [Hyphomicrobiaceae bacterium]